MTTKNNLENALLQILKKSSIFSLYICKHKQDKLASFTANILPCTSFSAQATNAKHAGLVTSIKSERKNELNRQVMLSNTALSKTAMARPVPVSSKGFEQRFR